MLTIRTLLLSIACAFNLTLVGLAEQFYGYHSIEVDRYGNGTPVLDGESYAFVWTREGCQFQGFQKDGSLVNTNDNEVLYIRQLAKDGKCQPVNFVVSDQFLSTHLGGNYMVIALDTRTLRNTISPMRKSGSPTRVNGWAYAMVYGNAYDPTVHKYGTEQDTNAIIDNVAKMPPNPSAPVITGISMSPSRRITIRCSNTMDYLQYYLVCGTNLYDIAREVMGLDGLSDQELEFVIDEYQLDLLEMQQSPMKPTTRDSNKFFKVIGR